jgi:hypothetical protein
MEWPEFQSLVEHIRAGGSSSATVLADADGEVTLTPDGPEAPVGMIDRLWDKDGQPCDGLSTRQAQAVAMILQGHGTAVVAKALRVTGATVSNWRRKPEVRSALMRGRQAIIDAARDQAIGLLGASLTAISDIVTKESVFARSVKDGDGGREMVAFTADAGTVSRTALRVLDKFLPDQSAVELSGEVKGGVSQEDIERAVSAKLAGMFDDPIPDPPSTADDRTDWGEAEGDPEGDPEGDAPEVGEPAE